MMSLKRTRKPPCPRSRMFRKLQVLNSQKMMMKMLVTRHRPRATSSREVWRKRQTRSLPPRRVSKIMWMMRMINRLSLTQRLMNWVLMLMRLRRNLKINKE
jgi:hypothetical protein